MNLSAIALDYDGTIARNDALDASVREAIAAARAHGISVLLVTGKILADLRRHAGDLHFVDGVVAENGAVLHFPDTGHTTSVAPAVLPAFTAELSRHNVPFSAGDCLVDANVSEAVRILNVVRDLELPLVLLFNGGRVMTLAQGISKATGLHAALDTLRLSARNTIAIGDAENDHEMLRLVEVGVAVEWGSAALRQAADIVLPGTGPAAVAQYLLNLAQTKQLPVPPRARRRLLLGYTEDGREFSLAVRGRNVLIAGDVKSGKSWIAGLIGEQLILHGYCVCVIDPEGDYVSLEALPGVTVLGGEDPPPTPKDLLRALRYPDRSVVVDLSHLTHEDKIPYIRSLLPSLNVLRQRSGLPHRILIDEAHYFLHDDDPLDLLDLDRNGYIIVTYRASRLPKGVLHASEVMIVTCESDPSELEALRSCCAHCGQSDTTPWPMIGHLRRGQAVALPTTAEAGGELKLFTVGPRLTPHVRHREKYVDVPVSEHRAFVFSAKENAPRRARTMRQFVLELESTPLRELDGFLRRGDFSRWVADVFGDHALAAELRSIEARYRATPESDVVTEAAAAVRAQYDLAEDEPAGTVTAAAVAVPA
jgi:hydroxymethylpyrimidine pyrophosphatase-like HAD family hydrolase